MIYQLMYNCDSLQKTKTNLTSLVPIILFKKKPHGIYQSMHFFVLNGLVEYFAIFKTYDKKI